MPRIYKPAATDPASNKAAKPVQETKTAKAGSIKENTEKKDGGDK